MQARRRILLADDDAAIRAGVSDLLVELGLEIFEAETGLEALEVARRQAIDAALLDFHMPGLTGLECLPRLREVRSGLPCIVYSGALTSAIEDSVLRAGAFAVLRKPVQPHLLRSEILRALAGGPPTSPNDSTTN